MSLEFFCESCGAHMMPTETGCCCPEGCGKIGPPLPKKVESRHRAVLMGIPDARQIGDHWEIEGARYQYVKAYSKLKSRGMPKLGEGQVLALNGHRVGIYERH